MKDKPIHISIIKNQIEELKKYLRQGVDVDILGEYDCTPLHYACREGNVEMLKLLINSDADVNKRSNYSTVYPIFDALSSFNDKNILSIVKLLINKGVNIDSVDSFGNTFFHYAVEKENVELIQLFIDSNCDINRTLRYDKDTPLHYAFFQKNREIILILVENGANTDQKNLYNKVPIDY